MVVRLLAVAGAIAPQPSTPRVLRTRTEQAASDTELVLRALEGDRWAEETLFRRHVSALTATVTRLLGDRVDAEDVVQDAFATALDRLQTLREPAAFGGWLQRIAVRLVSKRFRREKLARAFRLGQALDREHGLPTLVAVDASPELRAELALLDRELRRLPSNERLAWLLRHVEGHPLEDVADLCDCSLATAKRWIVAAHVKLRAHVRLGEEGDDG